MRSSLALLIAASVLLGGCTLAASPPAATQTPAATGGTLRVAIPSEVDSLDPWVEGSSLVATRQIF